MYISILFSLNDHNYGYNGNIVGSQWEYREYVNLIGPCNRDYNGNIQHTNNNIYHIYSGVYVYIYIHSI